MVQHNDVEALNPLIYKDVMVLEVTIVTGAFADEVLEEAAYAAVAFHQLRHFTSQTYL